MMSIKHSSKKAAGFTLVEVLITSVILAMIGITMTSLIIHALGAWSSGCSKNDAADNADILFQKLNLDIREASGAVGSANELRLNIPPVIEDANGEKYCNLSVAPTVYRYYLANGNIYQQINSGQSRKFAAYPQENEVTFSVTGSVVTVTTHKKDHPEQIVDEFKVVMRNYQGQQ